MSTDAPDHDDDLDDEDDEDDEQDDGGLPDLAGLLDGFGLGGDGGAGGGLPDLGSVFEGFSKVQAVQAQRFEGRAGGGSVVIVANGRMEVETVTIAPEALDPPDAELVSDLVLAALRDLTTRITEAQQQAMGPLGGLL